jgi:non-ribosomal peptide synthetase component F
MIISILAILKAGGAYVPLDLKLKELLKMLFKPWLWLLLEPKREANLKAIVRGLLAPLPGRY